MTALVHKTELLQTSWLTKQVMHSEILISPFAPIHVHLRVRQKSEEVFMPDEAK